MRLSGFAKNKKGAAMTYAIMVLLLLATVIVALTALSTASYNDAVLSVSDDQSYYYAKSIGLAIKEQFKDGYNIAKVISALDAEEVKYAKAKQNKEVYDPKVTGTFNVALSDADSSNGLREVVNGTVQIRYARDGLDNANDHVIEVRAACAVNNSIAVVTSIFSCEDDSAVPTTHLQGALSDYDVILTAKENLDFNFTQASSGSGANSLNVYVYVGEDDTVSNEFDLYFDMSGRLTTTGATTISSKVSKNNQSSTYHAITGNMTSYGSLTLSYTGVNGGNGIHADGDVTLNANSFVTHDIYARGKVTVADPGKDLHSGYVQATDSKFGVVESPGTYHSAENIYAQGDVKLEKRAFVTGNVLSHGNVTLTGKGAATGSSGNSAHKGNTYVKGNIYADGDVTISSGAVVGGSVFATGNVTVQTGAFVVGKVQSVSGNVSVLRGGGVGGQVNAPKGTITLKNNSTKGNGGKDSYCTYLSEMDSTSLGDVFLFGGIGLFQNRSANLYSDSADVCRHTCAALITDDVNLMPLICGTIHITGKTQTVFKSVWIYGRVYVTATTPSFGSNRNYGGRNSAGNPYTILLELNMETDLSLENKDLTKRFVDLQGAHIAILNLGKPGTGSDSGLYDAYVKNGWLGAVKGRTLSLLDVQVEGWGYGRNGLGVIDAKIYASQYLQMEGSGSARSGNYAAYSYASGTTKIASGVSIDVSAINDGNYKGRNSAESRIGFKQGVYSEIKGTVKVGSSDADSSAYVILGDESKAGTTYFYGTMHAYVSDFLITQNMRLSDKKDGTPTQKAKIYIEIRKGGGNKNYKAVATWSAANNNLYVAKSGDAGQYRMGSLIHLKGNAYVAGYVYDFYQFKIGSADVSFTNTADARVKGTFVTDGTSINLTGIDTFSEGNVQATNSGVTVTLSGDIKVKSLRVNGKFNANGKVLTASGDVYIADAVTKLSNGSSITGKLTIMKMSSTNAQSMTNVTVVGDFYLGSGCNVTLVGGSVGGRLHLVNGNATLTNCTVTGAWVNGTLTVGSGATLKGETENASYGMPQAFYAKNFVLSGGTVGVGSKDRDAEVGTYKHTSGSIYRMKVHVTNTSTSKMPVVDISGGSAEDVYLDVEGAAGQTAAKVVGGSTVDYADGALYIKQGSASIAGGFRCGISCASGSLTIGSGGDTTEYMVGSSYAGEPFEDGYRVIYASGTVNWTGLAIGAYREPIPKFASATSITGGGDVTIGSTSLPVKGFFSGIYSTGGSVVAYVGSVASVTAKGSAKVYAMGIAAESGKAAIAGRIGTNPGSKGSASDSSGIRTTNGDIHVGWLDSDRGAKNVTPSIIGHFNAGTDTARKNFYIDAPSGKAIDSVARISCKDIYGVNNLVTHGGSLWISVNLMNSPTAAQNDTQKNLIKKEGTTYVLLYSLGVDNVAGVTGDFSINGDLKYASSIHVGGALYVRGIVEYGGSTVNLECLGGLYCLNGEVNVTSAFKGDVHLPNVTSITLNADIGVNADNVTSITLNFDISRSLKLAKCTSFTVASGKSIGGSLIISDSGKVVNNGTIGGSVSCGTYEGSGTVGKDLILKKNGESKITGSGAVTGNIWAEGSLNINTTATLGSKNSYIFAKGNITIKNAAFYVKKNTKGVITEQMNYILTTGGNITLEDCTTFVPKVWNSYAQGAITFKNSSTKRVDIASVLSYGYYIDFGTSSSACNYQTVLGNVEWHGSYSGHKCIENYDGTDRLTIKGDVIATGTGNIMLRDAKIEGSLYLMNTGTASVGANGSIKNLYVNKSDSKTVTELDCAAKVTGDAVLYGNSGTKFTLGAVDGHIHAHVGASLIVNGVIGGYLWAEDVGTITLEKEVKGYNALATSVEVSGGALTTKGKIASNLVAYNAVLHIYGDIGANLYHSADNNSSASTMKLVELGKQTQQISVGAGIIAHGRVVDNSKQTSASAIWVKGAYYADLKKDFANCEGLHFTAEAGASAVILGKADANFTIGAQMNIAGRLAVYTIYNQANKTNYTVTFNSKVWANALVSNCEPTNGTTTLAPASKHVRYSSGNDDKAKGADKHARMVDLTAYDASKVDLYYSYDGMASTDSKRVIFMKNVYLSDGNGFKGTCQAANTKFACSLRTQGQVALNYCILMSEKYETDINHCNKDNPSGDGAFLHTKSSTGGDNYFCHVTTFSNVSIYCGVTHIYGKSILKGCMYNGTSNEISYTGHRSTKLFYFGESVEFYENSGIWCLSQADVNLCAGRTIVWVKNGVIVVRGGSYIGAAVRDTTTWDPVSGFNTTSMKGNVNTNRASVHPGVFVSSASGNITIKGPTSSTNSTTYSATYEKGTAYVTGWNSSVTLDICAYRRIKVSNWGVVIGKDNKNDTYRYMAGLYASKYDIDKIESENGFFGYYHYNTDMKGKSGVDKRHYYSNSTDSTYIPNGEGYKTLLNKRWYMYTYDNWIQGNDIIDRTYSQTVDQLTKYYTPQSDASKVSFETPNGADINPLFKVWMCGHENVKGYPDIFSAAPTDAVSYTKTAKKNAPDQPTIGTTGNTGFGSSTPAVGDASVNPVVVNNSAAADVSRQPYCLDEYWYNGGTSFRNYHPISGGSDTNAANASVSFLGTKAAGSATISSFSDKSTSVTQPALQWTTQVTKHFDKTETDYWNTRFVPYVWKLPYSTSATSAGDTAARKILSVKQYDFSNHKDSIANGEFTLTGWTESEMKGEKYYVTEKHYSGSSIAAFASKLNNYRAGYDAIMFNSQDDEGFVNSIWNYITSDSEVSRRSKLLVFESGELPYNVFYRDGNARKKSWDSDINNGKKIAGQNQVGWYWGSEERSYYDVSWVFYTCADPTKPYSSAAKDLHVVLPQGVGVEFFYDAQNTVTVIGNGRLFLYLTTGDTIYFNGDAFKRTSTPWYKPWQSSSQTPIFARPIGGLREVKEGGKTYYEPLMYIIGAGTNIDLVIEDMPISAVIYMPFGASEELYGTSGSLKRYNQFKSMVNDSGFINIPNEYKNYYAQTTSVSRNRLRLIWNDNASEIQYPRWLYGKVITDILQYSSSNNSYNLNFKKNNFRVNLSDTVIGGKSYTLATFLSNAPTYSTSLLNWEYKGIKVSV